MMTLTADALTERQRIILSLVEERGYATIDNLAAHFGVSAQTVRRDVISLDAAGLLQRFHGGAGSIGMGQPLRLGHGQKAALGRPAKERIADAVVDLVPDGAAIFLDVGTTLETAAAALNTRRDLYVVTNSMLAAACFDVSRHTVLVLGGTVAGHDGSLVGEETALRLTGLRLDFALIGCSAVEPSGIAMDFDLRKIAVKKAAISVSRVPMLLAAPEKFGRSARAEIAPLAHFDHILRGD